MNETVLNDALNDQIEEPTPLEIIGVVTNCTSLVMRAKPEKDSKIVSFLRALDMVIIKPAESTDEFYKVQTEDQTEGFCMRRFISIKE